MRALERNSEQFCVQRKWPDERTYVVDCGRAQWIKLNIHPSEPYSFRRDFWNIVFVRQFVHVPRVYVCVCPYILRLMHFLWPKPFGDFSIEFSRIENNKIYILRSTQMVRRDGRKLIKWEHCSVSYHFVDCLMGRSRIILCIRLWKFQ